MHVYLQPKTLTTTLAHMNITRQLCHESALPHKHTAHVSFAHESALPHHTSAQPAAHSTPQLYYR
eukprot:1157934-Pelagomonas_calceolata.AAC.1